MTIETALRSIRATYAELDGWQERARRMPPEQPEHGSLLAVDDAAFPWHSISELARLSLITSGEHLRLARTAIEAHQVYPSAHFTVLRGALVRAAQAVWSAAAEDAAGRQERGFTRPYDLGDADQSGLVDGVEFPSRCGDECRMWAVFERLADEGLRTSRHILIQDNEIVSLHPEDPEMQQTLQPHVPHWDDDCA